MKGPLALWRILIALIACLGPALQYGLMVYDETLVSAAVKSVEFFSYFTILTNMLAAAALIAPLVAPNSAFAAWAERSGPRAAIATYLAITAVSITRCWPGSGTRKACARPPTPSCTPSPRSPF